MPGLAELRGKYDHHLLHGEPGGEVVHASGQVCTPGSRFASPLCGLKINNIFVYFWAQKTTHLFIIHSMNSKQMKRWLEQQGATFQPGKGSHLKVFLNGKQSSLPMHGTAELGKGLEAAIKRQLGLK